MMVFMSNEIQIHGSEVCRKQSCEVNNTHQNKKRYKYNAGIIERGVKRPENQHDEEKDGVDKTNKSTFERRSGESERI